MPHVVLEDHPRHLTKYEGQGTKTSTIQLFNELGKTWKCNLGFSKIQIFISCMNWEKLERIHSPRPTFQYPNFESMDELRKGMS